MQVASQLARLGARLEHIIRRVSGDQRGEITLVEGGGREVAAQICGVGTVLRGQAGQQEGDLGLLRVARETDERTSDIGLQPGGHGQVRHTIRGGGHGVVAPRGREAGNFRAELLDRAHAQVVLLLQAAEVLGVIGAGAVGKTGDEGLVDRHRGGELINKELEVPGELHDLIVGAGRRARRGARGRRGCRLGGGRTEEQKAAHDGEEAHLSCDSTIDCQDMIGKSMRGKYIE